MKANAPEKIYVCDNVFPNYVNWEGSPINTKRIDNRDIEYTRTDAFMKKALAYLNDKFCFNNVFYGIVSTDFNAMEELFEDFRAYMKQK